MGKWVRSITTQQMETSRLGTKLRIKVNGKTFSWLRILRKTIFKASSKLAKVKANPDKVEILNKNVFGQI